MQAQKPIRVVVLLTLFLAGQASGGDRARTGDVQTGRIGRSGFSLVSSEDEVSRLLKAAQTQQAAAVERVKSLRGEGLLEVWFVVPELTIPAPDAPEQGGFKKVPGPFEVNRASNLSFLWSAELQSLRSCMESIPPTVCTAIGDQTVRHELHETLTINCLVRPDGFYRMFPNNLFGEFEGFPRSLPEGQRSRVVERMEREAASEFREFSDVFDPTCMFEIGGSRVDQLSERYVKIVATKGLSGRFALRRQSDGTLLTSMQYVNSVGPDREPDLTVDIVLGASFEFLPTAAQFINREGMVIESLAWDYSDDRPEPLIPTWFERVKFDRRGERVQKRSVTITEFEVNRPIAGSEVELSSIGVRDGDRLLDRIEKKLSLIQRIRP